MKKIGAIAIILALLGRLGVWAGSTILDNAKEIATLKAERTSLHQHIVEIKSGQTIMRADIKTLLQRTAP